MKLLSCKIEKYLPLGGSDDSQKLFLGSVFVTAETLSLGYLSLLGSLFHIGSSPLGIFTRTLCLS